MHSAAIAIGSNLGNPAQNVRKAISALRGVGDLTAVSRLYRSEPWGEENQPQFINAVVLISTTLEPRELLTALQEIEREMGRTPTYKWGPRIIDLDIVYYDDISVDEPDLKIPHPHFRERSFVLVPLAEIDSRYADATAALPDPVGLQVLE
ncbi:MAG: 2-amino-4-hydroxy-6-hydroxymethyldihydropteridine diphosphokinase [Candidatus Eremiobacteraeota bacterium]|nr:2-amino-4-hydroxy-6-hydroxymethyldihydropteridine diphosphokinase [Candidatus Eremiobacteraeota bacterium]